MPIQLNPCFSGYTSKLYRRLEFSHRNEAKFNECSIAQAPFLLAKDDYAALIRRSSEFNSADNRDHWEETFAHLLALAVELENTEISAEAGDLREEYDRQRRPALQMHIKAQF